MGKKGSKRVLEEYGSEHMSDIAKKSRKNVLKNDPDYYKKLSAAGVAARKRKEKERNSDTQKFANLISGKKI